MCLQKSNILQDYRNNGILSYIQAGGKSYTVPPMCSEP